MSGGGGSSKKAAKRAAAAEAQRQAAIAATVSRINSLFSDPGQQQVYGQIKQASSDLNMKRLNEDRTKAARENMFKLARSGLVGSSQQSDTESDLQKQYDEGVLSVQNNADQASVNAQQADQSSKQSLISRALAGLDATTASNDALSQMQSNAAAARSQGMNNVISGLFSNFLDAYAANQLNQGRLDARSQYDQPGAFYPGKSKTGNIYTGPMT